MKFLLTLVPPLPPVAGDHLVGPSLGPCPPVPRLSELGARLLARMLGSPLGLVAVDVASDLRASGAERTGVRRQLADLIRLGIEGEAMRGERGPELWVRRDGSMADAVDGLDRVPEANRVKAAPAAGGVHAGVDLQVKVTVGVARGDV